MKWVIWVIGGLLAALWTGAVVLATWVTAWTGGALERAGSVGTPSLSVPAELPVWLTGWFSPESLAAVVQTINEALVAMQPLLPALGTATGWLQPLLWILWGLGMVVLLAATAALHWVVARRTTQPARPAYQPLTSP